MDIPSVVDKGKRIDMERNKKREGEEKMETSEARLASPVVAVPDNLVIAASKMHADHDGIVPRRLGTAARHSSLEELVHDLQALPDVDPNFQDQSCVLYSNSSTC